MAVSLQSARPLKTLENALYVPRFVWVSLYGFWLDLMFYGFALLSEWGRALTTLIPCATFSAHLRIPI